MKKREPLVMDEIIKWANSSMGQGTIFLGTNLSKDPLRLPSGVFSIDYATGGGFPMWATTCLWGAESGGKTSLGIHTMGTAVDLCWRCFMPIPLCTCSASALRMQAVWADAEGTLDRTWAKCIGANPEEYSVVLCDYGEQYVNVVDKVLRADDVGLIVFDSIGSMVPNAEMEAGAEDKFYAVQTQLVTRFVRQVKQRLIRERKNDHPCLVVFTNQLRMKIGQKFGNPETMTGGHAMKHEFSLVLRCTKKALGKTGSDLKFRDEARSKEMAQRHSFAIRKEKILTIAGVGEYVRLKEDIPELGLRKGMVDDYQTVMSYAREIGLVTKVGNKWKFGKQTSSKLENIKRYWMTHPNDYFVMKKAIIEITKSRVKGEA